MTRHFGRLAFYGAVGSWAVMAFSLVASGLDPSPGRTRVLQALATGAVMAALAACGFGLAAIVRGTGRPSGALGLVLGVLFLLMFTSAGFAIFT